MRQVRELSIVTLAIPAHAKHVALARTAAASMAAHAGFTIDRIDDVRLAIDEAVALSLPYADLDNRVGVELELIASGLEIRIRTNTSQSTRPSENTFAWMVLSALVDELVIDLDTRALLVSLRLAT